MQKFNAFTLRLTDYIIQNHPDRITEKDFIETRAEEALQTFSECSRMGMRYEECKFESDKVLYRGLNFSPYKMVEEIMDTHFPEIDILSIHRPSLIMQILVHVKPVLARYVNEENDDTFQGSESYPKAQKVVKRIINQYIYNHGLQ